VATQNIIWMNSDCARTAMVRVCKTLQCQRSVLLYYVAMLKSVCACYSSLLTGFQQEKGSASC